MRFISGLWFFLWGKLFSLCFYDRKYLRGRWFTGRFGGIFAPGWRWVTMDGFARIFLGHNKASRFPVSHRCTVICPENMHFHPDQLDNFQSVGIYYQAFGDITIGYGSYIGPNVGIITANHKIGDLDAHEDPRPVTIGNSCWIGMNSVILPGVVLGDNTIVGAGSVVTKSFMGGGHNCRLPRKIN